MLAELGKDCSLQKIIKRERTDFNSSVSSLFVSHEIIAAEGFNPSKAQFYQAFSGLKESFPFIFEFLLLLIYARNIIPNSDFEPAFLPIISFIKIFVTENVAK